MNKQSYETPVMTEFELLSEQTFLSASDGLKFGKDNQAGGTISSQSIWEGEL